MTEREPADLSMDVLVKGLAAAVADYNSTGNALVHIGGYLGRSAVFRCGDLIVKCFFHSADTKFARECRAYDFLAGSGLPVPVLIASGRLDAGPPWILTTGLPGQLGAPLWKNLKTRARIDLNRQTGTLLARLHLLPVDERLTGLPLSDARLKYFELLTLRLDRYAREAALIDDRADVTCPGACLDNRSSAPPTSTALLHAWRFLDEKSQSPSRLTVPGKSPGSSTLSTASMVTRLRISQKCLLRPKTGTVKSSAVSSMPMPTSHHCRHASECSSISAHSHSMRRAGPTTRIGRSTRFSWISSIELRRSQRRCLQGFRAPADRLCDQTRSRAPERRATSRERRRRADTIQNVLHRDETDLLGNIL